MELIIQFNSIIKGGGADIRYKDGDFSVIEDFRKT